MSSKRVTLKDIDGYVRDEIFAVDEQHRHGVSQTAKLVREALFDNATPKQRKYLIMYYKNRMTMQEIAQHCSVDKSTVSRTVTRGRNNILRGMKSAGLKKLLEHINDK